MSTAVRTWCWTRSGGWRRVVELDASEGSALRLLADVLCRPGATARLRVAGDCMAPLVRGGDEVVLRGVAWPPAPGALVVAVSSSGAPVCHRVVEVDSLGEVRIAETCLASTGQGRGSDTAGRVSATLRL